VALKGKRLAFIEVKRRKTKEEAAWMLPPGSDAASSEPPNIGWPAIGGHDVVLAAPFAWPRYMANAFPM
jgi:putative endonuclease